jgi:hypothetical protein
MVMKSDNFLIATASEQSLKDRTSIGKIREIHPEIEDALAKGIRLKAIYQSLIDRGYEISSFKYFKNILFRIRKELQGKAIAEQKGVTSIHSKNRIFGKTSSPVSQPVLGSNDMQLRIQMADKYAGGEETNSLLLQLEQQVRMRSK